MCPCAFERLRENPRACLDGAGSIELPAGDCAVCMNCGPTTTSTLISERRISRPRQHPSVRIFWSHR